MRSGTHIGAREGRVLGDHQLTGHGMPAARAFPDVIAHGACPVGVHNPRGRGPVARLSTGRRCRVRFAAGGPPPARRPPPAGRALRTRRR
ncbi:hypothetical protein [Streptomyces sp. NPDC048392]|uniref:hypothetical protein n=1 Tax=Streptomyces sp. NPDC048392 TaxID=3365543 RepID=UPI0037184DF3